MPGEKGCQCWKMRSKSKNAWCYAICMKYMLHLMKKIQMLSWDFPISAPCDQNGVYLLGQLELN